jgi:Rrf2 family transcriptional regulator, iron-sulfur cluster assembly transcription factor
MIFNKSTEYSVRILLYMCEMENYKYFSATEIARAIKIPKEYLSKILQQLTKKGFVYSKRGKGGGFKIIKTKKEIKIMELINLFENKNFYNKCLIGLSEDCEECRCIIHSKWTNIKSILVSTSLDNIKIKKLLN